MPSKYLECNCLHITDPVAIERIHSLFVKDERTEPPKSRYQKSNEEVMKFLKNKCELPDNPPVLPTPF
jgi:hypothetical protein